MEDTFDRLLQRHTYEILRSFLQAYFESRANALSAVCEHTGFPAMLERTGAVLLTQGDVVEDQLMCQHGRPGECPSDPLSLRSIGEERCVSATAAKKHLPRPMPTSGNVSLKSEDGSTNNRGAINLGRERV